MTSLRGSACGVLSSSAAMVPPPPLGRRSVWMGSPWARGIRELLASNHARSCAGVACGGGGFCAAICKMAKLLCGHVWPLRSEVGGGEPAIHRQVDAAHPACRVAAQEGDHRRHFVTESRALHAVGVFLHPLLAQHLHKVAQDGREHRAGGHPGRPAPPPPGEKKLWRVAPPPPGLPGGGGGRGPAERAPRGGGF